MLTEREREALKQFSEGVAGIFALPKAHPADLQDVVFHVHAIQSIVMARAAIRAHPDEFHREEGFE